KTTLRKEIATLNLFSKVALFTYLFTVMHIPIKAEQLPIAIIGGRDGSLVSGIAYAAFVDLNTNAAGPALIGLPTAAGSYVGVSINNLRQAFVGGANGLDAYAA